MSLGCVLDGERAKAPHDFFDHLPVDRASVQWRDDDDTCSALQAAGQRLEIRRQSGGADREQEAKASPPAPGHGPTPAPGRAARTSTDFHSDRSDSDEEPKT